MARTCNSCGKSITQKTFNFCPFCGKELNVPVSCATCGTVSPEGAKFCPKCGSSLAGTATGGGVVEESVNVIPDPPPWGITIEFLYSTAASFDFALQAAQKFPTFEQYGEDKKALYRVRFLPEEMAAALELVEHLKGWRRRAVYVNGEKATWESVFQFQWCYGRKCASFKPEFYCFGYENTYQLNPWGCVQTDLSFGDYPKWATWGRWKNQRGDWEFDKDRIRHEIIKQLYQYRFCPAMQPALIEEAVNALPDVVNPNRDKDWKFVQSYDESTEGLVLTTKRFGFSERVVMIGVAPNGNGAIKKIAKKLRAVRLPPSI